MTRRSLSLAVALGALGGAVLVLSASWVTGSGKLIILPWALVVLGITLAVRAERLPSYVSRFTCSLVAFVMSSVALYVALLLSPHTSSPDLLGHAWRLAFIIFVGSAISLATARISAAPPVDSASCA